MHATQGSQWFRFGRFGVAAFAAAGMLSAAAWAQSGNSSSGSSNSAGNNAQAQKAPEGYVLIEEDVIALTANEPQNHFLRAEQYLTAGDPHAAAAEVRIAAAYLDMQASRNQGKESNQSGQKGESLTSAAKDLRNVAEQLQKEQPGKSNSSNSSNASAKSGQSAQASKNGSQPGQPATQEQQRLTKAFADADEALACHFQSLAEKEINSKKAIRAGHDLDAAASAFQAALAWSGKQPPQQALKAVADARQVSVELLEPQGQGQTASAQAGNHSKASSSQGNSANAESTEEAQPAAARFSGSESGSQSNGRIPDNAAQVVKELGSAIQSCQSGQGSSGQSSHSSASGKSGSSSSAHSGNSGSSSGQQK